MRSYTSSSDTDYRRAIAILLAGAALCVTGLEMAARLLLPRLSRIEGRMVREHTAALRIRDGVLLVGNSMLDEGVDTGALQKMLPGGWNVYRFPVGQTAYHEWKYGLRRLAADGSRPRMIAAVLTPNYVLVDSIRGDYSAHYLLRSADLIPLGRDMDLHPTRIAGLWAGIHSKFFATRTEIRKVFLAKLLPRMPELINLILRNGRAPMQPAPEDYYRIGSGRLRALREQAGSTPLVLIVHPSPHAHDGTEQIARAAREAGVAVVSVPEGLFTEADFRDGHHLTSAGALKFTVAIAPRLSDILRSADGNGE